MLRTEIAPEQASMYSRPSTSQIRIPSPRTASSSSPRRSCWSQVGAMLGRLMVRMLTRIACPSAAHVLGRVPGRVLADRQRRPHLGQRVAVLVAPRPLESHDPAAPELRLVDLLGDAPARDHGV